MKHFLRIEILCLFLLSCASSPKPAPRVADPSTLIARGMVFQGGEGVRVELVELTSGKDALIQVTGTRSEVEGKVLEHRIVDDGGRMNYVTQIYGRDQYTLVRETSRFGGDPTWNLYVRGSDISGMQVAYDQKASQALDTVALYRKYETQRDDGTLAALQRFDRQREQRDEEAALAETAELAKKACQGDVAVTIDWSTIDDDTLKELSIAGYCEHGLDVMRQLCDAEGEGAGEGNRGPARAFFAQSVGNYRCRFGKETGLAIADRTMTWTVSREGSNLGDFARKALLDQPAGKLTLGRQIALGKTQVCADEKKGRYVVFAPDESGNGDMLYGDGKTLREVSHPAMMSSGWFFEPRYFNPKHNESFRGLDLRHFSYVEVEDKEPFCTVMCGARKTRLPLLAADKVPAFMSSIKVEPAPMPRVPHALARDRQGTYYYVDRSTEPGRERDFQLYVGKLGNLKRQSMKNVVADSEGEIFSSSAGDLRFVIGKDEALWITGKNERKLLAVPIEENWQMIYNNLGVYFGQDLGNPCDHYGAE
jgi:hypothetical protein